MTTTMVKKLFAFICIVAGIFFIGYAATTVYGFSKISNPTQHTQGYMWGAAFVGFMGMLIIIRSVKSLRKKNP